jgi:hypothetical protein
MSIFADSTFTDSTLVLDENEYTGCTFTRCILVYRGGDLRLVRNTFHDCRWSFDGAAARTVALLQALAKNCGPDAEQMVRSTLGL